MSIDSHGEWQLNSLDTGQDRDITDIAASSTNSITAYTPTNDSQLNKSKTESQNSVDYAKKEKEAGEPAARRTSTITAESMDSEDKFKEKVSDSILPVFPTLKSMKSNRKKQILNARVRKEKKIKSSFMGLYVGLLTAVGGFLYGYDTGVINGLLEMDFVKEKFSRNGNNFDSGEKAILTSILSLGTILGSLLSPYISDNYGRRFCLVWSLITFFSIGTALQISHASYGLLLSGRLVNGIAVGIISSVIPLFQAEVSPRWIRGSVISFYQWAITWGLLVSSAISQGTRYMNDDRCYRIPIGLQFVWCGLLTIGLVSLPESPRFYVMHDDIDGAIISLSRLRRLNIDDTELVEELIEIKASHDYETSDGPTSYLDCFRSSRSRDHQLTRMMTGISLQTFQQCSGINFIFYYGVNFFVATGIQESYLMSFVTYAVNVAFTIPGILFVDKIGRRKLLIFGAIGMIISNYVIAIVGLFTNTVIINKIMLAFVCTFIACFASSWGPVVWVVTGELYNLSVRQKAVSLSASTNWIVNFVFAYSTPYLIDQGNHVAALGTKIFFMWGSFNLLGLIITFFFVYETKGLMLEEVDELYRTCSSALKSSKYNKKIQEMSKMNPEKVESTEKSSKHSDKTEAVHQDNIKDDNRSVVMGTDKGAKNSAETGTDFSECHTNDSYGLTPMEYLNRWEQQHQRANILSDNIITRQSVLPFSDSDDDDVSGTSTGNGPDTNFMFDYGLYGEDPNHVFRLRRTSYGTHNDEEAGDRHYEDYDEEQYKRNLREIVQDVNEQTGIGINLRGVDNEEGRDTEHTEDIV